MDIPPSGPQQPWPGPPQQPGPQHNPYAPPADGHLARGGYPGQQPPGGPYQAWPGPYVPYGRPGVNGLAIASLVLGILCCVPGLGLLLGALGLAQIRKTGERGKGLAVTGMVMSAIGLVLVVLALIGGAWGEFKEGLRDGARDSANSGSGGSGDGDDTGGDVTFSLGPGECFNVPGGTLEGLTYDVVRVPCERGHDGEVFANFDAPAGSWPRDNRLSDLADEGCRARVDQYAMDAWALPEDADIYYFTPTEEGWNLGDREITCMFGNTDADAQLTGTLRNNGMDLDKDQVAYLAAAKLTDDALASAPDEEYVEDDLPGHKRWAQRMVTALREQERKLTAHTWPTGPAPAVADEVAEVAEARKLWAKAAAAGNADDFYRHYTAAEDRLTDADRVPARRALGLDTTPPAAPEEPGGQEDGGSGGGDSGGSGAAV